MARKLNISASMIELRLSGLSGLILLLLAPATAQGIGT